jgi:putative flippase GtrA
MACGGGNVLLDMFIFNFANYIIFKEVVVKVAGYLFKPHVIAQVISFSVCFPVGFVLNKFIVFTESELRGRVQLFRYAVTALCCFVLSIFFIKIFIDLLHFNALLAKILTTAIVIMFSYYAQQYFSFKVKTIGDKEIT